MNYNLNDISEQQQKTSTMGALQKLLQLILQRPQNRIKFEREQKARARAGRVPLAEQQLPLSSLRRRERVAVW